MDQTLKGKQAIVVGGSRGIGRAVVQALANAGANVGFSFVRDERAATTVVEAIRSMGGVARAVRADSSKASEVVALFDALGRDGAPNIVVNVAGTARFAPLAATSDEDFDAQFDLNARGAFFVLREAARRVADGGRIVQVSTGGTTTPNATAGTYLASKAAGEQLAFALAREVGARRVTVNVLSSSIAPKPSTSAAVAGQHPRPDSGARSSAVCVDVPGRVLLGGLRCDDGCDFGASVGGRHRRQGLRVGR